jgi:S-(hydroxymethyl)glutathione dehydrogenase/alcohol dehydrogenase
MGSPAREIPRLLDRYRAGSLKLDELVTRTYSIEQINEAFADMHGGRIVARLTHCAPRHHRWSWI